MWSVLLVHVLYAAGPIPWPPASRAPASATLVAAEHVETYRLPDALGVSGVHVDALGRTITLDTRHAQELARWLRPRLDAASVCPVVRASGNTVILGCLTRRIDAIHTRASRTDVLTLLQIRGMPQTDAPRFPYPSTVVGLTESCPGSSDVMVGECARAAGDDATALAAFLRAAAGPHHAFAALRLGDMAAEGHELDKAAAWYEVVDDGTVLRRVARSRLCEVRGTCLGELARLFDGRRMPEPMRTEMELGHVRALAFHDRAVDAARVLGARLAEPGRATACTGALPLCQHITLTALRDAEPSQLGDIMGVYVQLPALEPGPMFAELAREVAVRIRDLGLPGLAGRLLSSVTQGVPRWLLEGHLQLTAECFLDAEDHARALNIVEYAYTQVPRSSFRTARWQRITAALTAPVAAERHAGVAALTPPDDPTLDVSLALAATARARLARQD